MPAFARINILKVLRSEKGAALVVALGILSIMVIIGATVSVLSMNSSKMVGHDARISEAQNLAEAGLDDTIAVTLANYVEIYPYGPPDESYPGDGMPFFDGPQEVTDAQGQVAGTYEVWTKGDPDRPGNVLITAEGTVHGDKSKVRASVQYIPEYMSYALMVGDPSRNHPGNCEPLLDIKVNSSSRFEIDGRVHVNGRIEADGEDDASEDGNIVISGPVTYTDTLNGSIDSAEIGLDDEVAFPSIDYDALPNKITVDLNGNLNINADDFEALYGAYDYVEFINTGGGSKSVSINGSGDDDDPWVITSTLVIPPQSNGNNPKVRNLDFHGPGLSLQPRNGIAVIADEGKVQFWRGTTIGAPGEGVLVYITGNGPRSELLFEKGAEMYGSLIVGPDVEMHAIGNASSPSPRDKTIRIEYDSGFLDNLPPGWLSSFLDDLIAIKENFEIDNSG